MKKILLFLLPLFSGLLLSAQQYDFLSPNDTLTKTADTLYFTIPAPSGIWTDAELTVYYQGHFYFSDQYLTLYSPDWEILATTGNSGDWCMNDSLTITIPKDSINAWTSGGNINFYLISTPNTNITSCTYNFASIRLSYKYCSFGPPVEYAQININDSVFCPYDNPVTLNGSPAGGVFSGSGVNGNQFVPTGLASDQYTIHYVATDAIGCTTETDQIVVVLQPPIINDTVACPNSAALLHQVYPAISLWFNNAGLTGTPDTAVFYNTGVISETTTWYVQDVVSSDNFELTSVADTNAVLIDFNSIISDDRGGIAITPDHVFFIGDGGIGRFNHNLDPNSVEHFFINDGIFSDLKSGKLLSLWDGNDYINDDGYSEYYYVKGFRILDSNMNVIGLIPLSQTIEMGDNNDYSGIFSGFGFTILFSGTNYHSYLVDNVTGMVSDLGDSYVPNLYDSENWASWGIAEYDGTDYSVVFRDDDGGNNLTRLNYTTGGTISVKMFSDLSDCATVGYSPWDNRLYMHFEGGSQWYGDEETGCYLSATDTIFHNAGTGFGCYTDVTVTVPTIDIGPSDTTICVNETLVLFAGTGYQSYTWNGINNNYNVCFVDTAGTIELEVVDNMGCTLTDAITVIVDSCTGINDPAEALISIYPNPASDMMYVEIPANLLEGNTTIAVADAQGRIVLNESISAVDGVRYELDVRNLDKGLYQLIITSETKQFAYRLIKQ